MKQTTERKPVSGYDDAFTRDEPAPFRCCVDEHQRLTIDATDERIWRADQAMRAKRVDWSVPVATVCLLLAGVTVLGWGGWMVWLGLHGGAP